MKTNDGYTVRLFALAFTDRCPEQVKVKCYAQTAQIKKIQKKMHEIMFETFKEPAMYVESRRCSRSTSLASSQGS